MKLTRTGQKKRDSFESSVVAARARGRVSERISGTGCGLDRCGTMNTIGALREELPRVDGGDDSSSSHRADSSSATTSSGPPPAPKLNVSFSDFEVIDEIGEGSFGEVLLVRRKVRDQDTDEGPSTTNQPVALKVMQKRHILKEKKGEFVRDERNALDLLRNVASVVQLQWTFQDYEAIYLGLEHCTGGELFDKIQSTTRESPHDKSEKIKGLSLFETRTVASSLLHAVAQCHLNGVVHRDLKPENILFDGDGELKLCDFGSCLLLNRGDGEVERKEASDAINASEKDSERNKLHQRKRALAFVGTCDYVAPEILGEPGGGEAGWAEDLSKAAPPPTALDWWSYGIVLYQCVCGVPPFRGANEFLTYMNVQKGEAPVFPEWWMEENGGGDSLNPFAEAFVDLVLKLLMHDPFQRLGSAGGAGEICAHTFFAETQEEIESSGTAQVSDPIHDAREEPERCDSSGSSGYGFDE